MEVNMKAGICSTAEIIRYEQHTLIDGWARVTLLLYIMRSAWEHRLPKGRHFARIHDCLVHTSKTRCIRTISDMTGWHHVASAYFCRWCFVVDSLVSFDLFSMQVTLLSFSVESESTFLDYIKGGWVERETFLLSCCSYAVNHTYDWILMRQLQGGSHDFISNYT